MKTWSTVVIIIVLIAAALVVLEYTLQQPPATKATSGETTAPQVTSIATPANIPTQFTIGNKTYDFTGVATTLQEQEEGLMNATVTNSTFELFVFTHPAIYPFWMKDTYYPLDIIWINGNDVVYIVNATPCVSYSPGQDNCTIYNNYNEGYVADYVIEAQAGFANRTGIRIGSNIFIN